MTQESDLEETMTNITRFKQPSGNWGPGRPGLRTQHAPWRAIDLRGEPPENHPLVLYGKRGKALIAIGQVWVELHTQHLYRVVKLIEARETFYPYDVVFSAYKDDSSIRFLAEATFRLTMRVWDIFERERSETIRKLNQAAEAEQSSLGAGFFGLDQYGYRID